jgi:hypothetical protein
MFLKVLIISVILVAFIIFALGVKLWLDPNAEFTVHSCAFDDSDFNKDGGCSICQLKDLTNCQESKDYTSKS